ncbi:ABC transporter G family member 10 [Ricinus communis]|uniref:ABC transporter G family member 10 n=1 Tax=Ricinus communis TaxID=3988 RepID=UPI00201B2505|nr:ABC transporter G family member 10 [Ricinus communis]
MELPVKSPINGGWKSSYRLETIELSYMLCSKFDELNWSCFGRTIHGARNKFILKDVCCEARPGEVTAIAGPSGAGKTTLLEILAGRVSCGEVSDRVLVNNKPMDAKQFRRLSGYVTQNDALFPLLTVRETLMYSALLRLPGGRKEAANRVKRLMKELGLDHVADSRIGEGSDSGISGGERRRVSIGVDLVHDPDVVLIDEPTSGLDSASALHVVTLLKSMAVHQCKTIILTIHQPGSRILELFDRIVLLCNGFVMHNDSLHLLEERLKFVGHYIPRHVNVLEFAIDVIESLDVQHSASLKLHEDNSMMKIAASKFHKEKLHSYPNSVSEEVLILGERFCSNIFRTKQLFATRVIQALVAGLVLGTIFLNVGNKTGHAALQTLIGFFAFSLTFLLSSTTEGLPIFLQERRILMRETSRGAYRICSYVLSNTFIFLPFLLMVGLLYSTPVYWLVGLRRDIDGFLYYCLVVWMVLLMSNSFVACFSALVPNFIMGTSVIAGLMGSFFLFSGYFISKKSIPSYWIFMHYLSLFKYPFECFLINEYGGEQGSRRCLEFDHKGGCNLNGSGFLRQQDLKESQKWSNLGVMLGFIVGYRVLCYLILWYRYYRNR